VEICEILAIFAKYNPSAVDENAERGSRAARRSLIPSLAAISFPMVSAIGHL
jgi:hypothetical protein